MLCVAVVCCGACCNVCCGKCCGACCSVCHLCDISKFCGCDTCCCVLRLCVAACVAVSAAVCVAVCVVVCVAALQLYSAYARNVGNYNHIAASTRTATSLRQARKTP